MGGRGGRRSRLRAQYYGARLRTPTLWRSPMRAFAPALMLLAACAPTPSPDTASATPPADGKPAATATSEVRPGIDVFLANVPERFRGKRVAFLTNNSGIG